MKIGIIILNWNGLADTRECLNSLLAVDYPDFFVLVIDNGSKNNEADAINSEYKEFVEVIKLKENTGYARGNNIGIRRALKRGADAVLLLNNDVIVDKDFLAPLVQKLETTNAGIVGPKILNYYHRNKIWYGGGGFHWWTGLAYHDGENQADSSKFNENKKVSFITGCSMLIKKEVIKKIGNLDEEFPLYWEDSDYCFRAVKNGFNLWYVPASRIMHKISQSTGAGTPNRTFQVTRSRFIFLKKHLSIFQWVVFAFVFVLYKIPLKILQSLINKDGGNLRAFFRGISAGISYKIHKFK
jgi:hypothetical protein